MDIKEINELLPGRWMHSHEEDNEDNLVFRPATFQFPRSRGRSGFEFRPDRTLIEIKLGPADGLVEQEGQWELDDKGSIRLESESTKDAFKIISAEKDRLVVKRYK